MNAHTVIVSCCLVAGCQWRGEPDPMQQPVLQDQIMSFAVLFKTNCAGCHGADGTMGPAPPLNDSLFRAIVPPEEIEHVLTSGRPGTPMPAFARESGGTLTKAQIQLLVYEIKGLPYRIAPTGSGDASTVQVIHDAEGTAPYWGTPAALDDGAPTYLAGDVIPTDARAAELEAGALAFGRACATCHGTDGLGIVDNSERSNRINAPAFLALISDQALRRIIITGRPDLGMPGYADSRPSSPDFRPLNSQELSALVALLADWREGVAANESQRQHE
jgi:mono/diheme cytochrome c family protein